MRAYPTSLMIACLTSVALLPGLALAEDAPPAVQAFLANVERQIAIKPSYDALKTDGNGNVTITNFTLAKPAQGEEPAFTLKTGEITFTGISDEGKSLFLVEKAGFANISVEVKGKDVNITAAIPQAAAEGWYIRALGATPTPTEEMLASPSFARRMESGKVTLTAEGQSIAIDNVESTWSGDPHSGSGSFGMKISNIAIPETALAMMGEGGMLKQLGYSGLNLDIATTAETKVNGEKMGYGFKVGLTGRDIGTLSVDAALDDIPVSAYAALMKAQTEGKEPDYAALMPQLQGVQVTGASLRFEDQSIVNKLMPMFAAAQGLDEKTYRASIAPTVQLMLLQLQNEAFAKQAAEAVTAFFASPKSLTITAKPPAKLTVSDISAMDPNKPGESITKLGITISAND
jgi:hypothetical protein